MNGWALGGLSTEEVSAVVEKRPRGGEVWHGSRVPAKVVRHCPALFFWFTQKTPESARKGLFSPFFVYLLADF